MNPTIIGMLADDRTRELRGELPHSRRAVSDLMTRHHARTAARILRAAAGGR
ncbi:MAG: hypothetical protein ACYCYK_00355 [Candidatus Dormibacteria bacterium]